MFFFAIYIVEASPASAQHTRTQFEFNMFIVLRTFDTAFNVFSWEVFYSFLLVCAYARCCRCFCSWDILCCHLDSLQERWKFMTARQDEWEFWMIDDDTIFSFHFIYSFFYTFKYIYTMRLFSMIYFIPFILFVSVYELIKFIHTNAS